MIQPKPFKYKCPKCGYTKVVKPKSDALNPIDMNNICPKCKAKMRKTKFDYLDSFIGLFK